MFNDFTIEHRKSLVLLLGFPASLVLLLGFPGCLIWHYGIIQRDVSWRQVGREVQGFLEFLEESKLSEVRACPGVFLESATKKSFFRCQKKTFFAYCNPSGSRNTLLRGGQCTFALSSEGIER